MDIYVVRTPHPTQSPSISNEQCYQFFAFHESKIHTIHTLGNLQSARIGDAQDGYDNGIVNAINLLAKAKGIELDMTVNVAVALF